MPMTPGPNPERSLWRLWRRRLPYWALALPAAGGLGMAVPAELARGLDGAVLMALIRLLPKIGRCLWDPAAGRVQWPGTGWRWAGALAPAAASWAAGAAVRQLLRLARPAVATPPPDGLLWPINVYGLFTVVMVALAAGAVFFGLIYRSARAGWAGSLGFAAGPLLLGISVLWPVLDLRLPLAALGPWVASFLLLAAEGALVAAGDAAAARAAAHPAPPGA